jgi:alanyl-tRNA synthetase
VGNFKHLTFFEMLGNFSIGDYFKKEAIAWAWEFVSDWLKIPKDKLWITIFRDDDESCRYWQDVGVSAERILRCGEEDNFWGPAGETGPCGPCSEIHYDFGEQYSYGHDCSPSCSCGRFLEIWNLVFTEYYQDAQKKRTPLPQKNIDTGMGLERTATVIQGKRSFYDTDLFAPIMQKVSQLTERKYGENEKADRAMRIVAEHIRAVTFLIADGVIPSKEGRGYVLRRILRRAEYYALLLLRAGLQLPKERPDFQSIEAAFEWIRRYDDRARAQIKDWGQNKPFLPELIAVVADRMGGTYPELTDRQPFIKRVVEREELKCRGTLTAGENILRQIMGVRGAAASLSRDSFKDFVEGIHDTPLLPSVETLTVKAILDDIKEGKQPSKCLSGMEVFTLHDTYGLDKELTTEIAADNGLSVDLEGFEVEMERQRERARAKHKFVMNEKISIHSTVSVVRIPRSTDFVGHRKLRHRSSVAVLLPEGKWPTNIVSSVSKEQYVGIILKETPFYAEMGGQVGDTGQIRGRRGKVEVTNTVRITKGDSELIVHEGRVVKGTIFLDEMVTAEVDRYRRLDIERNHTATHLLHAALRQVLGSDVHQAGSLVAPERFRFDFTYETPVLKEELSQIQRIVNEGIRRNLPVTKKEMPHSQAVAEGAIALFGEKYGDVVRTVKIGSAKSHVSFEVCGGTHLNRTGDIGFFQIVSEGSIGSGMRRIEAVTGRGAEKLIEERASILEKIAHQLQVPVADVEGKLLSILEDLNAERKRAVVLERRLSKETAESLLDKAQRVKGVSVLAIQASVSNTDALRHMGDVLREKLGSGVIVLAAVWDDRPNFLAMVTPDLVSRGLNAGDIVKKVAQATGGSGGGRAEMAQGGGKDKDKLEQALKLVAKLVGEKV